MPPNNTSNPYSTPLMRTLANRAISRSLMVAVLCCVWGGYATSLPRAASAFEVDDEEDNEPVSQKRNTPVAKSAPEVSNSEAESNGRDALRSLKKAPWYDAEADGLKSIDPPTVVEDKGSRGTWEGKLDDSQTKTTTTAGTWDFSLWNILGWILRGFIFLIIAAILGTIGFVLFRYFNLASYFDDGTLGDSTLDEKIPETPADKIEELPFDVRAVRGNLLDEARACYEQGDFNRAVVYLYGYQLVQLDKRQQIELAKGKTNRQYLWELRSRREMKNLIEPTVVAFEDAFFGEHDLDRSRFEPLWKNVDRFHQLLEQPV